MENAVRTYRSLSEHAYDRLLDGGMGWEEVWARTPRTQVDRVKSLIIKDEHPLALIRSSKRWALARRRWKKILACLGADGVLIPTNVGLIYAVDEAAMKPGMYAFGVNVTCIPLDALKSVSLHEEWRYEKRQHFLRLELARRAASVNFDIPLDEEGFEAASDRVVSLLEIFREGQRNSVRISKKDAS
jgi:hypothetical protein